MWNSRGVSIARGLLLAALTAGGATDAVAQHTPPVDLTRFTIEDLMNIQVTSAARKEQRFGDVPSAIYVITQDDIRRSGMTTLPELLRLVPGVQVAQINANKWAVAVRGFNKLFADKLLVLIDGRTVYDRLNSSVFWESLDIPLDQIERIEVTRGPGGATWGANAVNGVISIVTRHARDTPGAAVTVSGGTFDGMHVATRYGGANGRLAYRLSSQFAAHGQSRLDAKGPAGDSWKSQTHRVRVDWSGTADTLMLTGDATFADLQGLFHGPTGPVPAVKPPELRQYTREFDALGRWTRRLANGSSLQLQSFIDFRHNDDSVNPRQTQVDVDAQYHTTFAIRHDVVMGGGYRFLHERVRGGFAFSIIPGTVTETIVNLFAQDEIALGPRVRLTLGAKVERNSDVGTSVQPTARVMWSIVPRRHQVWGAASRAERSPSLGDLAGRYNFASFIGPGGLPVVIGAVGSRDFKSERVLNVEAGYRLGVGSVASLDVTAFQGRYQDLKTSEPLPPFLESTPAPLHRFVPTQFGNLLDATTSGVEVSAHLTPVGWWRLDAGYSAFHLTPHLSPASRDAAAAVFDGSAPRDQWQVRSAFSLPRGVELDGMFFHSGPLRRVGVGGYTRADVRFAMPLARGLMLSAVAQNLFDPAHAEFAGVGAIVTPTRIPRSARIQLSWRQE
jgi:iron complex outermembrane recepter protein